MAKLVDDAVASLVKKAVLTPEYMKQAWAAELEYARAFGATTDEVLLQALKPGSHNLPVLAGCHVFPIFPGAAAMYVLIPLQPTMPSNNLYVFPIFPGAVATYVLNPFATCHAVYYVHRMCFDSFTHTQDRACYCCAAFCLLQCDAALRPNMCSEES